MSRLFDYDYQDLVTAYDRLGVSEGKMVYVASDMVSLMRYVTPDRGLILESHLKAIRELLGPNGTIFVPTATLNLCNTAIPFDLGSTPSHQMGVFSEYVRLQKNAFRSFHPFWSVTGIGARAEEMLLEIPRHAYGYGSIWQKFVENNVMSLNIGKHPRQSITLIHQIEVAVGVPYRYTKEFIHPVVRNGSVVKEPFYLSVLYKDCDIVRDKNLKIFDNFEQQAIIKKEVIGKRGAAWSFSLSEFYKIASRYLSNNIYAWLERPPYIRPYRF